MVVALIHFEQQKSKSERDLTAALARWPVIAVEGRGMRISDRDFSI